MRTIPMFQSTSRPSEISSICSTSKRATSRTTDQSHCTGRTPVRPVHFLSERAHHSALPIPPTPRRTQPVSLLRFRGPAFAMARLHRSGPNGSSGLREPDDEGGAAARLALGIDRAVVLEDEVFGDGQAQSHSVCVL